MSLGFTPDGYPRHRPLVRVLQLIRVLEATRRPLSLDDLARTFQVTPRTIRRDLEVLAQVGARVEVRKDEWSVDKGFPPMQIVGLVWPAEISTVRP